MLTIKYADGTAAKQGYVYSLPVELLDASKATTVSFTCYGNQCFLSEIRTQGSTLGAQLLAGHKEKLLAKRGLETSVPVLASIR